jgi:ectoine hydroxylase-related dioxygenase (phytanoyl-CoA dioxygenase family)
MSQLFGPPPTPAYEASPTADDIAFFEANGFVVVERLTSDEEIAWLRQIFEFIFDPTSGVGPNAPVDRSGDDATGGRLGQAFFPEMRFPEILQSAFYSNAKRYAAALLRVDVGRLSAWGHMIGKPPGARAVDWHQDHAYWQPEFDYHALGVWLPMHDVSIEMGAMQFVAGSHKRGLLCHRHLEDPAHNLLTVDEPFDAGAITPCPLKMGGATFHHAETLHYTAPNTTAGFRMAFPMEFQLTPVRRAEPAVMPWVDEHRAKAGVRPPVHVADGKVVQI